MTVLIPAVGYLLLFNDKLHGYFDLWSEIFHDSPSSPLPWRLFSLYFGLTMLAIGSIVFQIRCPPEIKRYGNEIDYIADLEAHASKGMKMAIERRLGEDEVCAPVMKAHEVNRDRAKRDVAHLGLAAITEAEADYWREVFRINFHALERSRPISRQVTTWAYYPGFLLVAIPSADVFSRVLAYFVNAVLV
jgi:hypothetical protein